MDRPLPDTDHRAHAFARETARVPGDLRPQLEVCGERQAVRELAFPPRATIFLQGDAADAVYQVIDGAVMLYRLLPDGRRQLVELIATGGLFGCGPQPLRDCTAETLLPTRCVAFERQLLDHSAALAQQVNLQLSRQLSALHEHVLLLGRKTALERVASFLMRHIPQRGHWPCPGPGAGNGAQFQLTLLRQEIADYLGLTIETVSRLLTSLRRRGVVHIEGLDEVEVNDVCRLCRLTGTHLAQSYWCSGQATAAETQD